METKEELVPAPDFRMADTEGKMIRLSDYRGQKHVVLVFNRGMF
jgi:peroxiredoxin